MANTKQAPIPVIPATMKIVNPDGTVTRSGQQLLQQLQASNIGSGVHADRPLPGDMPDGAIWVDADRGVIYQNQGGNWQYIAGTMYGTLVPDQRPADLGAYDGGFEFRANDTDPAYRGRDFVWSGTAWVETTPVLYGPHADRPDATDAPARCLYVEQDRGSVLYQNQGSVWQYIAGIMYGTLVPDQRPTDLGPAADAGFQFRTNVDPAQAFTWSGTEWIETTPIRYGTHADRLAAPIADLASGILWMETDRGSVIYQNQGGVWLFLTGTMWGTLVPDQRPTDLGVHDAGFDFRSTVAPPREFIWNQVAWVEVTALVDPTTAKGDLIARGAAAPPGRLAAGTDGQVLSADSTQALGLKWITPAAGSTQTPWTGNINGAGFKLINTGQVGIGTASPTGVLNVNDAAGGGVILRLQNTGTNAFDFIRYTGTGALTIQGTQSGFNHIVLCPTSGNVGIGLGTAANPTNQLQLGLDSAGKPSTSTWSVVSDLQLKQNVEPVSDDSLAILGTLDWVRYEYNGLAGTPKGAKGIGLVAQELQKQLPEAVRSTKTKLNETDDAEADVLTIDYHHVIVHSARAIQQLGAEIKALKALLKP
jgi:hypothetical protein